MALDASVHCFNHIFHSERFPERLRWTLYTLGMIIGLTLSLGFSLAQYFNYVTIFREAFIETKHGRYPDITICQDNKHMIRDFLSAMPKNVSDPLNATYYAPWSESSIFRAYLETLSPNVSLVTNVLKLRQPGHVWWFAEDAKSIFHRNFQRFFVDVYSKEPFINVTFLENVPSYESFVCITIQAYVYRLRAFDHISVVSQTRWNDFESNLTIFFHEANTKLSAFKPITRIHHSPTDFTTVHYSTRVQSRLPRSSVLCEDSTASVEKYGHTFAYTQAGCLDVKIMASIEKLCGCIPDEDVLSFAKNPCPHSIHANLPCIKQVRYNRSLLAECRPPCISSKLTIDKNIRVTQKIVSMSRRTISEIYMTESVIKESEVHLYTVEQLLNEMAGLCSLFLGLTSMVIFEVLAVLFRSRGGARRAKKKTRGSTSTDNPAELHIGHDNKTSTVDPNGFALERKAC